MEKLTLVIGLGEIGKPLHDVLSRGHHPVRGIDQEPVEISEAIGLMHICYPFDIPHGFVDTTVEYVRKYRPETVVINSTVPPGTTRTVAARIEMPVVFSPVRGKHTKMVQELTRYCKFVAGADASARQRVRDQFTGVGMKSEEMANPETLELAKLLETTYFGLLIAWAQEMERIAKKVDGDYMELTRFFSEIDYLPDHVFVPGHIGGHCVMPNIMILKKHVDSQLLDGIVASNRQKAEELGLTGEEPRERLAPIPLRERKSR